MKKKVRTNEERKKRTIEKKDKEKKRKVSVSKTAKYSSFIEPNLIGKVHCRGEVGRFHNSVNREYTCQLTAIN